MFNIFKKLFPINKIDPITLSDEQLLKAVAKGMRWGEEKTLHIAAEQVGLPEETYNRFFRTKTFLSTATRQELRKAYITIFNDNN